MLKLWNVFAIGAISGFDINSPERVEKYWKWISWTMSIRGYLFRYDEDQSLIFEKILSLVGHKEACEILGWSKQQLNEYINRAEKKGFPPGMFPKPIEQLASGPIWFRKKILDFAAGRKNPTGISQDEN